MLQGYAITREKFSEIIQRILAIKIAITITKLEVLAR